MYKMRYKRLQFPMGCWLNLEILATWEAEIGRITVQGQLGKKVHMTPYRLIKPGCGDTHLSSQLFGKHKQEDHSPDWPEQKVRPNFKNNESKKKKAECMTQVVEYLPSKCEVLISMPSTEKKQKASIRSCICLNCGISLYCNLFTFATLLPC
jgi:hypothetical protein